MSASSTTEARGKVYYDPEPTRKFVKSKIGEVLDKGEKISNAASKTASAGFIPVLFAGVAAVLRCQKKYV
ncbi:MAG: hypothetical protein KR126chlam3_01310 [Chlamydiae bacterium]|nr:hypothetical protein [Chlamydiota bacterium]